MSDFPSVAQRLTKKSKHCVNLDNRTANVTVKPFELDMGFQFEVNNWKMQLSKSEFFKSFRSVFFQCFQSQSAQNFGIFSSMSLSLERRSTFQRSLSFPFLEIGWETNLSWISTKLSRQQEEEKSKMWPTTRGLGQLSSHSSSLEVESAIFSSPSSARLILGSILGWALSGLNSGEFLDPSEMGVNKEIFHSILSQQTQPAHSLWACFQNLKKTLFFLLCIARHSYCKQKIRKMCLIFSSCCSEVGQTFPLPNWMEFQWSHIHLEQLLQIYFRAFMGI